MQYNQRITPEILVVVQNAVTGETGYQLNGTHKLQIRCFHYNHTAMDESPLDLHCCAFRQTVWKSVQLDVPSKV